jgi:hypothetical protein
MLNFLVWVILIYFAILVIWRYIIPFFLKRTLRKFEQKMNQQSEYQKYNNRREGEVHIDHIPEMDKKQAPSQNDVEYVEFEEIKNTENKEQYPTNPNP